MATLPVLTDLDLGSSSRITNLLNAVGDQEPATYAQLKAAIEAVKAKDDVVAASTANINLAAPGATIDAVTMTLNDRFLAKNQSSGLQNGIYIWNGAAAPATRTVDANTWDELESALVGVKGGTANAATYWRQTAINGTLETTTLTWVPFGVVAPAASETTAGIIEIATQAETDTGTDDLRAVTPLKLATWSGRSRRISQLIGNASATSFTVTHNFNTREVKVAVFENSGNYREVAVEVRHNNVNSVDILFNTAPGSNAYMAVVSKS